jgi:hypothetical protein
MWRVVLNRMIGLLIILLTIVPGVARAQTENSLASVEADLWPEYDRSSMLVIYHITLSPQTQLPADVSVRIPANAGAPAAVAVKQPDGSLFTAPYTQQQAGEWSDVVFKATTPEVQVEYYDPNLTKDGTVRNFEYHWPGNSAVDDFKMVVQQPAGATNMRIKPGTVSVGNGPDGLSYYTLNVGPLAKGQLFNVSVGYEKTGDELTVDSMKVEPSAPLDSNTAGRTGFTWALPVGLGLLGVVLIAGGALWYWRSGQQKGVRRERRGRRHSASSTRDPGQTEAGSGNIYCHQCGKRAGPGDRFCRACGTPLRSG